MTSCWQGRRVPLSPRGGSGRAPVQVAHELVAEEGLAAAGQADQDDDQLLAVHPVAPPDLARNARVAAGVGGAALAGLRLLLAVVRGRNDHVLEVHMRAVLWRAPHLDVRQWRLQGSPQGPACKSPLILTARLRQLGLGLMMQTGHNLNVTHCCRRAS